MCVCVCVCVCICVCVCLICLHRRNHLTATPRRVKFTSNFKRDLKQNLKRKRKETIEKCKSELVINGYFDWHGWHFR